MSRTTNESNIDEIIEIVQAVKRHLQEDNCVHSLKTIITEAYRSKSAGLAAQTQPTTDDSNHQVSNLNGYRDRINC